MPRILYTAGPGNAFDTFRKWKDREKDLTTSHVSYSGQMLEACVRHGATALITCSHERGDEQTFDDISIVRRPDLAQGKSGLAYHRGVYQKAQQVVSDALDFNADIVLIAEDISPSHLAPLQRRGVKIVQSLHTRLWVESHPASFIKRMRLRGLAKSYKTGQTTILSCSDVVSGQVAELTKGKLPPIVEFLPLYYPEHYAGISAPRPHDDGMEVLFIGRIEENKGALDLVRIAQLLRERQVKARFHICGIGGALETMQQMTLDAGLADQFVFHGWCDRDRLRAVIADCHVSIVPTRSDFIEGFNQATVESVLAGRPAVVSDICPAVRYVSGAVDVVKADDIEGYANALEAWARDPNKLSDHAAACAAASKRLLDANYSFGSALDEIFLAHRENRPIRSRRIDPMDNDVADLSQ